MILLGLFLVPEIRTGGHVRYLELMEALARSMTVFVLLNPACGYTPKHFTAVPLPIDFNLPGPKRKGSRMLAALRKLHSKASTSPKQVWLDCQAVLVFGETHLRAAAWLSRASGVPLVYGSRHNSFRNTAINLHRRGLPLGRKLRELVQLFVDSSYESFMARRAQALVFQSQYDRNDYLSRNAAAAHKAHVVEGDILQPRFKPEFLAKNTCSDPSQLCFIGTLGERKGLSTLLEAIRILAQRGIRLRLKIAAAGSDFSGFAAFLEEHGLSDSVEFLGKLADVLPLLASSGLLVVPSEFDSFPNVVLEAIHVGCPVLGSESGGIPEMLEYPEALFPAGNALALAQKLETLQNDVHAYAKLRAACDRRRAHFSFDWAARWLAILEDCVQERK